MYLYVTPLRFVIADTWLPWLHLMLCLWSIPIHDINSPASQLYHSFMGVALSSPTRSCAGSYHILWSSYLKTSPMKNVEILWRRKKDFWCVWWNIQIYLISPLHNSHLLRGSNFDVYSFRVSCHNLSSTQCHGNENKKNLNIGGNVL